jgi:dephospho-CoA kinase
MVRVGLTGGIAAGKSTVGAMFVELGCHLIDSDRITHELLEPGQAVHDAVVKQFGRRILAPDGTIDRRILGEIVFQNPQAREMLNSLVHPAVIQRQQDWLREVEEKDSRGIAMVDAALMIEVGTYKNYDKVIVVICTPEIQRQRLKARSTLSAEQIEARIQAQMPMDEKAKFADFVIDNSGALDATREQVERVFRDLLSPLQRGTGPRSGPGGQAHR